MDSSLMLFARAAAVRLGCLVTGGLALAAVLLLGHALVRLAAHPPVHTAAVLVSLFASLAGAAALSAYSHAHADPVRFGRAWRTRFALVVAMAVGLLSLAAGLAAVARALALASAALTQEPSVAFVLVVLGASAVAFLLPVTVSHLWHLCGCAAAVRIRPIDARPFDGV